MSTLKTRIAELAGRVLLGQSVQQIHRPQHEPERVATVDDIIESRQTAENFAKRMIELATARDELDSAVEAERGAQSLDFAGAIAAGQELPDVEAIASKARASLLRAKAIKNLCDREVESAALAVLTLRRAASNNVEAATEAAKKSVREAIPEGMFPASAEAEIFRLSRPARECAAAKTEIDKLCAYSVPLANAELFGKKLPEPFRIEPLPTNKGQIFPRDAFAPRSVADDVSTVLSVHLRTIGFLVGMTNSPEGTRWTT